jgi:hypothetical protein
MPNLASYVALLGWPLVACTLYFLLPASRATLWTILGAQLLLPVGAAIKFNMVPAFDKASIPNLAAMIGCLIISKTRAANRQNRIGLFEILVAVYVCSPFVTAIFNTDPIVLANDVLPPQSFYDSLSAAISQAIFLIPLLLGRAFLAGSDDIEQVLRIFVTGMLAYALLLLFEIRMSPQLHVWLYGYAPSDFVQAVRDGGYRPMAFMGHGLSAALFLMMAIVSATALWKIETGRFKGIFAGQAVFLSVVLLLSKSLGALIYALVLVPLVKLATPQRQMRAAKFIVLIALMYPVLRSVDLVPTRTIIEAASMISVDRADSLNVRFVNEEALLRRASERFFFGWGRYGRSRIYDPDTGKDLSVTDGRWAITLGQFGMIGFLAEFGLFAFVIFRAASAISSSRSAKDNTIMAALALILSINALNLLPNAALFPWTMLITGSLLGRSEKLKAIRRRPAYRSFATVDSQAADRISPTSTSGTMPVAKL